MYVSDLQRGYVYHIHHSTNLINQGECHWYRSGLVFNEVRYSHWASIMWNSALWFNHYIRQYISQTREQLLGCEQDQLCTIKSSL